MKNFLKNFVVFLLLLCLVPFAAHAELLNPLGTGNIYELIGRIIKALLGLSGSIALLMFVYGGFQYLTSAGDPGKVKKGKDTLVNAVLGLAIIFGSFIVVNQIILLLTTATK